MFRWPAYVRATLAALLIALVVGAGPCPHRSARAQGGGTIGYGSKIIGRISAELPEVVYSFNGSAGDLVQVQVRNWVGTLDPRVALLAPDGADAGSSATSPFAVERQDATLALFLPQSGAYMLLVSAENAASGQFLLTLYGRGPVSAAPLIYGEPRDITVPQNPPHQFAALETADCPTILTVANLSPGQPFTFPFVVKVRNPGGALIALLYGGDAVEDRLFLPARSGRYEIDVLSDDPRQAGAVRLLATCADQAPGCLPGEAVETTGAEEGAAAECPPCVDEGFDGDACAAFEVTPTHEDGSTFLFIWPAVEGADFYIFSLVDAWDAVLEGSGIVLHGETSFRYTFAPADADRGPFTARVVAGSSTGGAVILCAAEAPVPFEGPPVEECAGIAARVDVVPGEPRRAVASWTAAPGAAAYTVHIYAYAEDGGLIGIRVLTVPGDATTYHLEDLFPADYTRFQVDVRAYGEATGGGAFGDMPQGYLCSGSADAEFPPSGPVEWGPAL